MVQGKKIQNYVKWVKKSDEKFCPEQTNINNSTSSFNVFWLLDESKWCKKREFQTQIVQQGKHMRNVALKENYFFSSNENLNDHLSAFSLQLFLSLICLWAACRSCCHCWTSLHLSRILTCVLFLVPFCRFFYELSASCNYIMGLVYPLNTPVCPYIPLCTLAYPCIPLYTLAYL